MKEVLEELISFTSSYRGKDLRDKCRELYEQKSKHLDDAEKETYLFLLADLANVSLFLLFCEESAITLTLEQAKKISLMFSEKIYSPYQMYDIEHERISNLFVKTALYLDTEQVDSYFAYAFELAIRFDFICALQNLLARDKEMHFITKSLSYYDDILSEQQDLRIAENVKKYFQIGEIGADWKTFLDSYKYIPDIFVNYFESEGKEICKENLKSYKKSKLLSKNTTLEELDAFVDQYNWDDGVEIPYFIMHHKNCDLALRKKLFELGAGDCIDEKTYVDTKKDPWKQFILELKEMIEKEEK